MQYLVGLIFLVFPATIVHAKTMNDRADSLPSCINMLSFANHKTFTEYNYKGQRWFSFTTKKYSASENVSDKMTTIRLYDWSCHPKATWMKGGVAGLNKILPDTIEKEKIVTVRVLILDTTKGMKATNLSLLPDAIYKLALSKNSFWIQQTAHQQGSLFQLQNPSDDNSVAKITFGGACYDKYGNTVAPGTITGKTFWWHYYGDRFYLTQFRPGYR